MKRDFDLIRRILKDVQDLPAGKTLDNPSYPGYDQSTINEHIILLEDAKLIKELNIVRLQGVIKDIRIKGLTWDGHDFLDAAKDDTIWKKAKESILKPGASITFSLLLEWLKSEVKQKLGLP